MSSKLSKTSKSDFRKARTQKKLKLQVSYNKYLDDFIKLENKQIYDLAEEIINELNRNPNFDDRMILENKLEAIKKVIDIKMYPNQGVDIDSGINYYPEFRDKNFNKKIFYKQEFLLNKTPKKTKKVNVEELSRQECGSKNFFKLSNGQKFIKTFLSPETPYNGSLLFYGTGVGKTCATISIVEQYMEELIQTNKKVYILLNPSIKANFVKNIFNIEKLKQGKPENQCTGMKYLNLIDYNSNISYDDVKKKVMSIINSRYKFMGYQEFANFIEAIENKSYGSLDEEMKERIVNKKIKNLFSNSILVIDEAHNIKEGGSKKEKILPPILERIISLSENMKLLLLSATPMFDNVTEIRFLLNLLLMNDNRPIIKYKELFDKVGNLTEDGLNNLIFNSRGYISYLRGEDPIKFPIRLYPDIYNHPLIIKNYPEIDIEGNEIPEENRINVLKILGCPMINQQLLDYNTMIETDTKYGAFDQMGIMLSNITFPSTSDSLKMKIGNIGFSNIFSKTKIGNQNGYKIKKTEHNNFLDEDIINSYSSKLYTIFKNIKNKDGIIFIYSQFIHSGILPLALMLEYNGYTFLNGNKEETLLDCPNKKPKISIGGNKLRFIIISGEQSLSKNSYAEYIKLESNNQNGELVKIILGTETAAEGLDFSYIREVHILDPWHHTNKTEQIIGRAVRYCSHINLPFEKRNVIVNLYASTLSLHPNKDIETIDLKTYRTAENKSKQMAKVEYILKQNAVDCNINKESNKFVGEFWDQTVRVKLPFLDKDVYKNVNIADKDGSKICNYRDCDYKCNPDIDLIDNKLVDTYTFKDSLIDSLSYEISIYIKELFKKDFVYDINNILSIIQKKVNIKPLNLINPSIYNALNMLIRNKTVIYDKFNRPGVLEYKGGFYIFKPKLLENSTISYYERVTPSTIKTKKINITKVIDKLSKIKPKIEYNVDDITIKLNDLNLDSINLINYDKKYSAIKKRDLLQRFSKIISFSTNWLDVEDKEALIKFIIQNKDNLNDDQQMIYKRLNNCILYFRRDLNRKDVPEDEIFGYKIVNNNDVRYVRYIKSEDRFTNANALQKNLIFGVNKLKERTHETSIIIGYMEHKMPENKMVLKIRDKTGEGKKGTQIIKGSICGNDGMKKNKIIGYIHKVLGNIKYDLSNKKSLPGKYSLCKELEIYLREFDQNSKEGLRWFYNAEEAIEFGITDKK